MKLTNQNIHDSILQFERLFPHDMQDRLLLKEVLLNFQTHFGSEHEYEFRIAKRPLGITGISIRVKGEPFDPLADRDKGDVSLILNSLLDASANKASYKIPLTGIR